MSLRCPRCSSALSPADDVGAGVVSCTCGVFFVTSEARKKLFVWLKVAEQTWADVLAQGKRGPPCACGATMLTASLKGVAVDGCATCDGLLLDPGELKRLTGLAEPATAPAVSTEPAQQPSDVAGTDSGLELARPVRARRDAPAAATHDEPVPYGDLGRVYLPSRDALAAFVGGPRAFHLLQVKSDIGGGVLGVPVNQPFQWTVSTGLGTATIGPDDDSTARQLLAFVTGNLVSSRFVLRDPRDNPLLVFVRKTRALLNAVVEVQYADDERPLGTITRSVVGFALDLVDEGGRPALRFEKRLGDVWGFSVVAPGGRKIGDVTRGFGNVEMDMSLLGGFGLERSIRRDDFELTFDEDVPTATKALGVAATFLVAHTSSGPGGITSLFD